MALVRIWKLVEGQIAWHWTGRVRLRLGACLGGSARVCTVRSIAELQNFHNAKWTVTRPLSVYGPDDVIKKVPEADLVPVDRNGVAGEPQPAAEHAAELRLALKTLVDLMNDAEVAGLRFGEIVEVCLSPELGTAVLCMVAEEIKGGKLRVLTIEGLTLYTVDPQADVFAHAAVFDPAAGRWRRATAIELSAAFGPWRDVLCRLLTRAPPSGCNDADVDYQAQLSAGVVVSVRRKVMRLVEAKVQVPVNLLRKLDESGRRRSTTTHELVAGRYETPVEALLAAQTLAGSFERLLFPYDVPPFSSEDMAEEMASACSLDYASIRNGVLTTPTVAAALRDAAAARAKAAQIRQSACEADSSRSEGSSGEVAGGGDSSSEEDSFEDEEQQQQQRRQQQQQQQQRDEEQDGEEDEQPKAKLARHNDEDDGRPRRAQPRMRGRLDVGVGGEELPAGPDDFKMFVDVACSAEEGRIVRNGPAPGPGASTGGLRGGEPLVPGGMPSPFALPSSRASCTDFDGHGRGSLPGGPAPLSADALGSATLAAVPARGPPGGVGGAFGGFGGGGDRASPRAAPTAGGYAGVAAAAPGGGGAGGAGAGVQGDLAGETARAAALAFLREHGDAEELVDVLLQQRLRPAVILRGLPDDAWAGLLAQLSTLGERMAFRNLREALGLPFI